MTTRRKPAAKPDEVKVEHEQTAGTKGEDPKVGAPVEVTGHSGGVEHSVNPPVRRVDEHQSVGADAEYVADDTVEPDFAKAEKARSQAAARDWLDSRTRNRP